jgi:hypothetical protein
MQVRLVPLMKGVASFLPLARSYVCGGTGGTVSARYCYSVWLRHLVRIGNKIALPQLNAVAELGPGDSLGIGLSAVLSGADHYYALDTKEHANKSGNLKVLDELIDLFRNRSPIPDDAEFPHVFPKLSNYSFPEEVLSDARLASALNERRVERIRDAIAGQLPAADSQIQIRYVAPWNTEQVQVAKQVDLVLSQAVLEHVEDIKSTYIGLYALLRPGGLMSHTIDFRCHGTTTDWNGHWTLSDSTWKLIRGTRPYLINRLPYSAHKDAICDCGFKISAEEVRTGPPLKRTTLAARFSGLSESDLVTSGVYIQATRPH